MAVDVFINFNGNCREAVGFYAEAFGVEKQKIMAFGDGPPNPAFPIADSMKNLVMYTFLNINGSNVMFSDTFPGMPFIEGNNITLTISLKEIDEVKKIFNKLKEGGKVDMDLQETFWSKCYGRLTDKFGIGWQISYDGGHQ